MVLRIRLRGKKQMLAVSALLRPACKGLMLRPTCVFLTHLQDVEAEGKNSMLVVSEFVGCSPSVSGAIRVNPWSIDSLADGIYTAIKAPAAERHLRHDKHWRYVSQHTVRFWAQVRFLCKPGFCLQTLMQD